MHTQSQKLIILHWSLPPVRMCIPFAFAQHHITSHDSHHITETVSFLSFSVRTSGWTVGIGAGNLYPPLRVQKLHQLIHSAEHREEEREVSFFLVNETKRIWPTGHKNQPQHCPSEKMVKYATCVANSSACTAEKWSALKKSYPSRKCT
jgi:hypothetical protein